MTEPVEQIVLEMTREAVERVVLEFPPGECRPELMEACAHIAHRFATEFPERKPGIRNAVIYAGIVGGRLDAAVYWTARRAVVVRVVPAESKEKSDAEHGDITSHRVYGSNDLALK
jgi:hypothetical protein